MLRLEPAAADTCWDGGLVNRAEEAVIADPKADANSLSASEQLSLDQKAEILDRFLNR